MKKEDKEFIYSLLPEWVKKVPKGMNNMFYGTLTEKGDKEVKDRVDKLLKSDDDEI